MKHIKLFEAFLFESSNRPRYRKPEYEFKEFYRAFRNYPELREILPDDIDEEIFNVKGTGFDGEPEWIDTHCDPPSKQGEIATPELIQLAEGKTQDLSRLFNSVKRYSRVEKWRNFR